MEIILNLPKQFEDKMKELLGSEYEEYLQSFEKKHYGGLRVNTLKITPDEFEKISPFEIKRVPWTKNGYYYNIEEQPARHPYYYAGLYYIQEPSAMTPASVLPIEEGDKVLDLCAAPGGKSTELGAKLKGSGVLVSNDISNSRAKALLKNIELFGIHNAIVVSEEPKKLVKHFPGYFDKILIDAPCSGEGMFRKDPSMIKNWEEKGVMYYSDIQKEIILQAADMLKPGGMILYSTCTFSPEENEETIKYLLQNRPEFSVEEIPMEEGFDRGRPEWVEGQDELKKCVRLWPHKIQGEGHFIALLRKDEESSVTKYQKHNYSKNKLPEEVHKFLKEVNIEFGEENFEIHEDKLYYLPPNLANLKGLRILRSGLLLGEMKKNRFEPSQPFANMLKLNQFSNRISLSSTDPNVIKYLKCETIEVADDYNKGWNIVCVDGYPLGWGKLTGTTLKNKYYAGWRWM